MSLELLNGFLFAIQCVIAALGLLTVVAFLGFILGREPIEFQGNWGGFGGGMGGWRISRSLGLLIATMIFGTLFALVGVYAFVALANREKSGKDEEEKKKSLPS